MPKNFFNSPLTKEQIEAALTAKIGQCHFVPPPTQIQLDACAAQIEEYFKNNPIN